MLRRVITSALLALFVVQSSGAAMASPAPPPSSPALLAQIQLQVLRGIQSLESTPIGAFLTGKETLWQAMHAPAPTPIPRVPLIAPDLTRTSHYVMPAYRGRGVPKEPLVMDGPTTYARAIRDQHAMAKTQSGSVTSQLCPQYARHYSIRYGNGMKPQVICCNAGCVTPTPAPTKAPTPSPAPTPTPTPSMTPTPSPTLAPSPTPVPTPSSSAATTGINRWWTYEELAVPGVGKAMINVANGNLIVQSKDIDIAERGIHLAFQRTYNSQSAHDAANSDGSLPAQFGNGWTNPFDAHVKFTSGLNSACPTAQGITMYDIDGARYDFAPDCNGNFRSPAGLQGTIMAAYSGGCIYGWHKKSGTFYTFFSPDYSSAMCRGSSYAAYDGRLHKIYGRNMNNAIALTYSWVNGDASNANNLATIQVTHSDGQQLTLSFALYNGHDELQSISRVDGQTVNYYYDGSGNLTDVCEIGNGSSTTASGPCAAGQIHHQYAYNSGSHQMAWVNSANWVMTNYRCGTYQNYSYDGYNRLTGVADTGTSNPYIADGTNGGAVQVGCNGGGSILQPSYTPNYANSQSQYLHDTIGYTSGESSFSDSDGHAINWFYDGVGRVTKTAKWTGAPNNEWINYYATWDSANNLTETVDPRGNPTDYGYDGNGNTAWVQQPQINTSMGVGRPVARYTYDQYNNVVAYCDPQYVWLTGATVCNAGAGVTHYTWNYSDPNEPYGYLTDTYTSLGYHEAVAYDTTLEAGDNGLPTKVTGDSISQSDGSILTPTQQFVYDSQGNLICYSKLLDAAGTHWWRLTYDNLNRQEAAADPDDGSMQGTVSCPNTAPPGISGSHIVTTTSYYLNGQISATQSPSEYAAAVSTTKTYDADGNLISSTGHYNNIAGTTLKWYDGADRLVEVQLPHDQSDYYSFNWLTRYIYDLSGNGTASIAGASGFKAYGNLYKTQEWLPSPACSGWTDQKGAAYDALDRKVAEYAYVPTGGTAASCGDTLQRTTLAYDAGTSTYGLLSSKTDALNETAGYGYDADGRTTTVSYSGDGGVTPSEISTYDPDGRLVGIQSSTLGTEQYSYDADGHLTQTTEPSGLPSAATIKYSYYSNGWRAGITATGSSLAQAASWQYLYRNDGDKLTASVTYGSTSLRNTWALSAAGRVTTMADNTSAATRQMSYDSYGRLAADSGGPGGPYSAFQYDAEGEPLSYVANFPNYANVSVTQKFTERGELQQQDLSNWTGPSQCGSPLQSGAQWQGLQQENADGFPVPLTWSSADCKWAVQSSFDTLSGLNRGGGGASYFYDAVGRQTSATNYMSGQICKADTCDPWSESGTYSKQYDAENHLIGQSYSTWPAYGSIGCPPNWSYSNGKLPNQYTISLAYAWGPNGHVVEMGNNSSGSMVYTSVHWDGQSVLFTSTPSNATLWLGQDGSLLVSGSSASQTSGVNTRDFAGGAGMPPSPNRQLCDGGQPFPDGITDGYNIFQGVRSYDPVLGTWSTPDAYEGEVSDPMSQHAYMWDGNNSFLYSDPSGFCTDPAPGQPPNGCLGGVDWNLNMKYGNLLQGVLDWAVSMIAIPVKAAESLMAIDQALNGASKLRFLGGYPAYIDAAYAAGGRVFHTSAKVWNSLTDTGRWALNRAFLDQGIEEGATFELAPGKWGDWTQNEVHYLLNHGYRLEQSGGIDRLVPGSAWRNIDILDMFNPQHFFAY